MYPLVTKSTQSVLWYGRFQSAIRVKREYQRVYNVHPNASPSKQNIKNWHTKFKENGNFGRKNGAGRPRTNPADVLEV
jgi:hypothetical protein